MTFEEAKAVVRSSGHKVTPYRVGLAMGRHREATFKAWSEKARAAKEFTGHPEAPTCPYTINVSVRSWVAGYRTATKR